MPRCRVEVPSIARIGELGTPVPGKPMRFGKAARWVVVACHNKAGKWQGQAPHRPEAAYGHGGVCLTGTRRCNQESTPNTSGPKH